MRYLLVRWAINAIALFAAVELIPGMRFEGGPVKLMVVALVFGIVNAFVRPILTILSCPLVLVTLGLFTLVINAAMLLLTARLSEVWNLGFTVSGFWPAFWGGLVVGIVSVILAMVVKED